MIETNITFPGIDGIIGAEVTLSRGVAPGVFLLLTTRGDYLDIPAAPLTLTFGDDEISVSDCAPDKAYLRHREGKRHRWSIVLLDRRRKWSKATIDGEYNRRLSDGSLDTSTQKTPAELAALCLDAVGESGYNVSRMPEGVYPYVNWSAVPVADALAAVLENVGCDICPQTDDTFVVWPVGQGDELPENGNELFPPNSVLPATKPSEIRIVGGPTIYQNKLALVGIGQEADGSQSLRDDLAYTPAGGWSSEFPFVFPSLSAADKAAGVTSVWRQFRVSGQASGGLAVPGCTESITSVLQYNLGDTLLESAADLDGTYRNLPAYVEGTFWDYADVATDETDFRYTGDFIISAVGRSVVFPQPMFSVGTSGDFNEPTLYLTTSLQVIRADGSGLVRLERSRSLGGDGGVLEIYKPELFASVKALYGTGYTLAGTVDTTATVEAEADAYLDILEARYQDSPTSAVEYGGIVPISTNGIVPQVSYRLKVGIPAATITGRMRVFDIYSGGGK